MDGFRLVMTQGPEPGQTFTLDRDTLTIGRDPTSEVVIVDAQVSRQHARLVRQGNVVLLEDLGSTNGTFVNGVRVTTSHALSNGDVIALEHERIEGEPLLEPVVKDGIRIRKRAALSAIRSTCRDAVSLLPEYVKGIHVKKDYEIILSPELQELINRLKKQYTGVK